MGMHVGLLRLVRTPCQELKRHLPLQNEESVCAEPIRNRSVQLVFCFCSYEWSWPNPSKMVGILSCSLGLLRYLDRALWSLGHSRVIPFSHRHTKIRICVAECKFTQPSTTSAMSPGIGWWHLAHLLLRVRSHGLCIQDISHGLSKQAMPGLEQSARRLSSIQQPQRHCSRSATNGQCPMPDRSFQAPLTGRIKSRRLERQTASANTNPEQSRRWSPLHASAHCQGRRQSLPLRPARHPCCRAGT